MKRISALLALCVLTLGMFAGCAKQPAASDDPDRTDTPPAATLTGTIVDLTEGDVMLAAPEGGLYRIARTGGLGGLDDASLAPGGELTIGFSGQVMESYPMQIADVDTAKVSSGDDLVGMYLAVIGEIWDYDPALNDNIQYLAFDLHKADNLTAGEKEAVVWLAAGTYGKTPLSGTYDELCAQGYITDMYFEDGLLLIFEVDDAKEDSFHFKAQKWRSGLGANFYEDCTARLSGGVWDYALGGFAIS